MTQEKAYSTLRIIVLITALVFTAIYAYAVMKFWIAPGGDPTIPEYARRTSVLEHEVKRVFFTSLPVYVALVLSVAGLAMRKEWGRKLVILVAFAFLVNSYPTFTTAFTLDTKLVLVVPALALSGTLSILWGGLIMMLALASAGAFSDGSPDPASASSAKA